jgi:hypothetical protein
VTPDQGARKRDFGPGVIPAAAGIQICYGHVTPARRDRWLGPGLRRGEEWR